MMVVADMKTLNVLVTPAIAASPEAAEYDPGTGLAFSSNGEGTMTIVKNVGGKWSTVYTVQTERSARTMTLDPKTHAYTSWRPSMALRGPNQARSRDVRRCCQLSRLGGR